MSKFPILGLLCNLWASWFLHLRPKVFLPQSKFLFNKLHMRKQNYLMENLNYVKISITNCMQRVMNVK